MDDNVRNFNTATSSSPGGLRVVPKDEKSVGAMRQQLAKLKSDLQSERARNNQMHREKVGCTFKTFV